MSDTKTVIPYRSAATGVQDPHWVRFLLIGLTVLFLTVFIILPTVNVFAQALRKGAGYYAQTLFAPDPGARPANLTRVQIMRLPPAERERVETTNKEWDKKQKEFQSAQRNWSAIRLTLGIVIAVVPLSAIFGLAAAWLITRFRFRGRSFLISLIDLPFSVSPVVSGLIFVLVFGARGIFVDLSKWESGTWLVPAVKAIPSWILLPLAIFLVSRPLSSIIQWATGQAAAGLWTRRAGNAVAILLSLLFLILAYTHFTGPANWKFLNPGDWSMPAIVWRGFDKGWAHIWPFGTEGRWEGVIFTPIAIALATAFVTFPFIARTLIPVMAANGSDEEVAALSLGATGWQMFRKITIPNAKWGLFYGLVLCTARACGEFGAASVVSGHIDSNDTMPLRIEKLWQETNTPGAFTLASLLTLMAVITLGVKAFIEWRMARVNRIPVKQNATPGS